MVENFRNKMAESIMASGDQLWLIENDEKSDVQLWLIRDHTSYNDPLGRADQFQVWRGNKRCYVGSNRQCAYADYRKQKEEFAADWALV